MSVAHLVRLFVGFNVTIGAHAIPVWLSGVGLVVLGLFSFWLWKLADAAKAATTPAKPAAPHGPASPAAS